MITLFMKTNLLLGIIVALLGYATCRRFQQPEQPASAAAPANAVSNEATGSYGFNASHVFNEARPDTAPTRQVKTPPRLVEVPVDRLPPATASRRAYLADRWWHLNMAFQPSDSTVYQNYQSKWLRFRPDQTFDLLYKGKVTDTGRWNWDEATNEIYLSCRDPYVNNTWQVHDQGYVMIWKGNTALNVTGIQIRVIGAKTPPPNE